MTVLGGLPATAGNQLPGAASAGPTEYEEAGDFVITAARELDFEVADMAAFWKPPDSAAEADRTQPDPIRILPNEMFKALPFNPEMQAEIPKLAS